MSARAIVAAMIFLGGSVLYEAAIDLWCIHEMRGLVDRLQAVQTRLDVRGSNK